MFIKSIKYMIVNNLPKPIHRFLKNLHWNPSVTKSNEKNILKITKKMFLHPFNEIQTKLGSLPFYSYSNTQ